MVKPPEHLEEAQCAWCSAKIRFIAEGVRNEKTEGFDLRLAGWVHLDSDGNEIAQVSMDHMDEDEPEFHDPTPMKGWT